MSNEPLLSVRDVSLRFGGVGIAMSPPCTAVWSAGRLAAEALAGALNTEAATARAATATAIRRANDPFI